jgi:cytochrome c oxidase subunit IV
MTDPATEVAEPGTEVVPSDGESGALVARSDQVPVPVDHGHHPTPRQYVLIAVILVVVTGIEIATSYVDTGHTNLIIVALFIMAALKFFLVAAWYMHMKSDQAFFRRIFVVGMVGAGVVYGILLFLFSSSVLSS